MITLSKIAKLAHVSISTASKAFSGSREVNEQTRETIFKIAKEQGVFKKFYNAKYPHLVIAVIVPEFNSGQYADLLDELQKCLRERGCTMSVTAWDFLPEESKKVCDYYSRYTEVDGLILVDNHIPFSEEMTVPVLSIGAPHEESDAAFVCVDKKPAILEAVRYLKSKNVPTVGFVSEPKTVKKLAVFKQAMAEVYGAFDERYAVVSDSRFEACGYEGAMRLVERGTVPRALLCGYDEIAVGAIRALAEQGLSVPRDVAVIGANDNRASRYTRPPLSTIDTRRAECAALAVDTVLNMIFSRPFVKTQRLEAILRLRASSEIL